MGLFKNTKKLCPVCGSPTPRLLPTEIQGEAICSDCDKKISMEDSVLEKMTADKLKEHFLYREENEKLHDIFQDTITKEISFRSLHVDEEHGLWYIDEGDKNPPIFRFDEMEGFQYMEDKRSIILITKDKNETNRSAAGIVEDEIRGMVSSENIIDHVFDTDDKLMRKNKPVGKGIIKFKIAGNPYWNVYSFNVDMPTKQENYERRYITDYAKVRNAVDEIAAVSKGIIDGNQ